MPDELDPTEPEDTYVAMLRAIQHGDDAPLAAVDQDMAGVDALVALVADPDRAGWFADAPRPSTDDGAHPGRLLLHATACMYRYDGANPHLGAHCLEALAISLDRGAMAWASAAATYWRTWLGHKSESATGWPVARRLLELHDSDALPATLLTAFACLAERAGDATAAKLLWERALLHPDTVRRVRVRCIVEYEWARTHLMGGVGAPARATGVLARVVAGLAAFDDAPARLTWFNAAIEQAFAHVMIGEAEEAVHVLDPVAEQLVEAESEFVPWLRALQGLAFALLARIDEAEAAFADCAAALTDTSSLELAAIVPGRAMIAALRGDRHQLRELLDSARSCEFVCQADSEPRAVWRLVGGWALLRAGARDEAAELVSELLEELDAATAQLPFYQTQARLLDAAVRGDAQGHRRAVVQCAGRGVIVPGGALDPWALVDTTHAPPIIVRTLGAMPIRVDVLDGLDVSLDGNALVDSSWQRRRKARVALALLVASGGVAERQTLVEALWPNEPLDHATSQSRLSTVLSALRRALPGTTASLKSHARGLKLHEHGVELRFGPDDTSDLRLLEAVLERRAAHPPRDRDEWLLHARALEPFVGGEPLRGVESSVLLESIQERLRRDLAAACLDAIVGWRDAKCLHDDPEPPQLLLDLAAHAARLQPLDEPIAAMEVELYAAAGRASDATRAFHRFRSDLDRELGLVPTSDLIRRHARIVEVV